MTESKSIRNPRKQRNYKAKEWGPHFWKAMHYVAHSYPDKPSECHKQEYCAFYRSLKMTLPCELCRKSYRKYFNELPIKKFLKNRMHLILWVFTIHKRVNKKLKKCNLIQFKNAYQKYEVHRATSTHKTPFDQSKLNRNKIELSEEFIAKPI